MSSLDSFFESVKLPSMSEVARALVKTLGDETVTVPQVRAIIARDPALTAKLLRLANSAQFGLPRGVATLEGAIQLVGLAKVRSLALGACISESFSTLPNLDRKNFWRFCMDCSGYAQWLAALLAMDTQQAWLAGLMLRLGELLIAQTEPKAMREIERAPQPPGARWEREKRLLGFSEGQITAELARRWNFPTLLVLALQGAHAPLASNVSPPLAAVLHLAGLLADTPQAGAELTVSLPDNVLRALQLNVAKLRENFPIANSFVDVCQA